jgi:hypothetical protein
MNSRQVLIGSLIGCGGLLILGVLLIVAIGIGTNIGLQKAKQQGTVDEGETTNTPKKERGEEYVTVVMRVSGGQGTRYRCSHSDVADDGETVQEEERGELASTPVEYRARVRAESTDKRPWNGFYGYCSLENPESRGPLKLELLVNDRVIDSDQTEEPRADPPGQKSSRDTLASVSYSPETGGPDPAKGRVKK